MIAEDIRVTGCVNWNNEPASDLRDELPDNVTAVRLDSVLLSRSDAGFVAGRKFDGEGFGYLPTFNDTDENVRVDTMDIVKLSHTLIGVDGERTVELRPDYFVFEDDDGRYSVYYQVDADTRTAGWLDSALHLFITGQKSVSQMERSDLYDEEWKNDLRITEVGIAAALARGDERGALIRAAYHFGIPTTNIVKHMPKKVINE